MKKNNDDGLFWVLMILILTLLIVMRCNSVSAQEENENTPNECVAEDPHETENIEKALVEQGYFSDLIPMDYDLQAELRCACEEFDVPFPLIVAIIEKETNFTNIVGDNGNAEGYMQIWEYWHYDKMEKIGATDLMNPVDNFRTGCYLMSTLLDKYDTYNALSVYNTGSSGYSDYAECVMELYNYWNGVL